MKKVSFMIDEDTLKLIDTIAYCEDINRSDLIRRIVRKEIRDMAYRHGILDRHEIQNYINK